MIARVVGLVACGLLACRGSPGGPLVGAVDTHCSLADGGQRAQMTSAASCTPDGGQSSDGGMAMDEMPTLFNAEGDDDDCKYHLAWTSTPLYAGDDVTFTATVKTKADGALLKGGTASIEAFLSELHPAPNSGQKTTEPTPGTYRIGPVRFDQPGTWTVRFHLDEACSDLLEDSPHGHVAFKVVVP